MQPTSPSWLRSFARRSGAYLAMLAVMLQLAASFGHMHARDFAFAAGSDPVGWHRLALTKATASDPGKLADDEDRCPICFSGFLLATSFAPHAAQPTPSVDFSEARRLVVLAFFGTIDSQTASFQSRAPPLG